jgi:hypothetical protein
MFENLANTVVSFRGDYVSPNPGLQLPNFGGSHE